LLNLTPETFSLLSIAIRHFFSGSGSAKIDQAHPECHEHKSEPAQRAFGRANNFLYPEFHFFRKRKIRQPFDNHNQSKDTQKKFHILKACPISGAWLYRNSKIYWDQSIFYDYFLVKPFGIMAYSRLKVEI